MSNEDIGAVVTTPEIAAALTQRAHFNTFGGNPVVCAQGDAVLEVIEREKLQANSLKIGGVIMAGLERLKAKHSIVGDVRGKGLLLGMELVKDRATKEPVSGEVMKRVYTECVRRGLLAMSYSPHLRLQPALTIDVETGLEGLAILDEVFAGLARSGAWQ